MKSELVKVRFYDDQLEACQVDGKIWVGLRKLCLCLGVHVSPQIRKLKNEEWACVTEMVSHDSTGRMQPMTVIDLETVSGWLFSVNAGKVSPDVRPKLVRYQRECVRALSEHFFGTKSPRPTGKPPAGCDWVDVVRTLADGQREIADEVVRVGRQVSALAERVEVIGTGVAHLMLNQRPQPAAIPEKKELFQSKRTVAAAIRAELVKNPHRSDEVILDEIRNNYGVSANRTTVYRHRTEMESTREIEPAPVRVGRDGRKSKVKYDESKLPFHTTVDDLNDATP